MEKIISKQLKLVLTTYDSNGDVIDVLSKDPCHPQLINSILPLLEEGMEVNIAVRAVE